MKARLNPISAWCGPGFVALLAILALGLPSASPAAPAPALIGLNFPGATLGRDVSRTPPDCNGVIGPAHFVQFIAGSFSVYRKTDGTLVTNLSDHVFWGNAGVVVGTGFDVANPRIVYDSSSRRWFAAEVDFFKPNPSLGKNNFLLAVSATFDPSGAWSAVPSARRT